MNFEPTWQAIPQSSLPAGDFRPVATFKADINQLALHCHADMSVYDDDGLGSTLAFFLSATGADVYGLIICHAAYQDGLMIEVHLLNRLRHPEALHWNDELQSVLNFLRIPPSCLEWASPFLV